MANWEPAEDASLAPPSQVGIGCLQDSSLRGAPPPGRCPLSEVTSAGTLAKNGGRSRWVPRGMWAFSPLSLTTHRLPSVLSPLGGNDLRWGHYAQQGGSQVG